MSQTTEAFLLKPIKTTLLNVNREIYYHCRIINVYNYLISDIILYLARLLSG